MIKVAHKGKSKNDEEECKRRLDAAHTRGPVRHPEPCAYDCGDCAKCRAFGEWADEQD